MNITNNFNNINDIKNFLTKVEDISETEFNNPDYSDLFCEKIKDFLERHLRIIANQKDTDLYDALIKLSNRIAVNWNNSDARQLSFEIMGIARGVSVFNGIMPPLSDDLWGKILSYLPPRDDTIRLQENVRSGLEDFFPSKKGKEIAKKLEREWISEQLVSLKKYGDTAQAAIKYAIDNKLTGVNLSEFSKLTENDLTDLFKWCPQLDKLFISSNEIRTLPAEPTRRLKALYCSSCQNLKNLPELPLVQILDCTGCLALESLPALPKVTLLDCSKCIFKHLPELPQVESLYCANCPNLQSLPALPQVKLLDCRKCRNLKSLPELPQVQQLNCSACSLKNLPQLPRVEVLLCTNCKDLQLPKLPQGAIVLE